jgi:hypothetical protein
MSRVDDSRIENPSKRWFQWSGGTGTLSCYDKDKKENVPVELPFKFLLLDELHTISGYNDGAGKGLYSNEVKDLQKEVLNVKMDKQTIAVGLYKDIKDKVKAEGGKYTKSCYIAYYEGKELCIGNIKMSGSSLSGGKYKQGKEEIEMGAWMEFSKEKQLYKMAVEMSLNPQDCKKGATTYKIPQFKLIPIKEETNQIALDLTRELNSYLDVYIQRNIESNGSASTTSTTSQSAEETKFNDRVEQNKAAVDMMKPSEDIFGEPDGGIPQEDTDIPF